MQDKYGDKVRLQHVTDAIHTIDSYIGNALKEQFLADSKLQDACIRQLQIIGEACNRCSPDFRLAHTDIPWSQIIGMRNIVVHDYTGLEPDIIWNIIKHNLPGFLSLIEQIVENIPDEQE